MPVPCRLAQCCGQCKQNDFLCSRNGTGTVSTGQTASSCGRPRRSRPRRWRQRMSAASQVRGCAFFHHPRGHSHFLPAAPNVTTKPTRARSIYPSYSCCLERNVRRHRQFLTVSRMHLQSSPGCVHRRRWAALDGERLLQIRRHAAAKGCVAAASGTAQWLPH